MKGIRLALLGFVLLCIFGFGLFIGKILPRFAVPTTPPQIQNTATILRQVQTLSELVTVKYVLERVISLEDVKWYGENRVMLVAHGIVKAGINLSDIKPEDIRVEGKKVSIKLPYPYVTDTYLDDKQTRVMERSTGIMRTFDKDLEQNARQQAVDDLNRVARNLGILKDAEERARLQVTALFQQMGFAEIEIQPGN
jgi:hypothetical protein